MKIEISKHNNKWGYTILEINGEVTSSNFGYKTIEEAKKAAIDQQKAIDRIFIALCGWSLKTLIEGHEAESYNPYA